MTRRTPLSDRVYRRKLRSRLDNYEYWYAMDTDEMRRRVAHGVLPETEEVCAWLLVAAAFERIGGTL